MKLHRRFKDGERCEELDPSLPAPSAELSDIPLGYVALFVRCFYCRERYRHDFDMNAMLGNPPEYRWLVTVCPSCSVKP